MKKLQGYLDHVKIFKMQHSENGKLKSLINNTITKNDIVYKLEFKQIKI